MAATTAVLVRNDDLLEVRERASIAGFLAGYTGTTRVSYTTDLRMFLTWCTEAQVRLLDVKRAHLELFARHMEAEGRMRSTGLPTLETRPGGGARPLRRFENLAGTLGQPGGTGLHVRSVLVSPTRPGCVLAHANDPTGRPR